MSMVRVFGLATTLALAAAGCTFDSRGNPLDGDGGAGPIDAPEPADAPPGTLDGAPPDAGAILDAAPNACGDGVTILSAAFGGNVDGVTTGKPNVLSSATCGGSSAGEDVYAVTVPLRVDLILSTAFDAPVTNYNALIYVRADCDDVATELGCAGSSPLGDVLTVRDVQPGLYFVIIDGVSGAEGNYRLGISFRAIQADGEPCDPTGAGSRCDDASQCLDLGAGFVCSTCETRALPLTLDPNLSASGDTAAQATTYQPACVGGPAAPEVLYRVDVVAAGGPQDLVVDWTAAAGLDGVLDVTVACGDPATSEACVNASGQPMRAEAAVVPNVSAGRHYVVVDGAAGTSGAYDISAWARPVLAANAPCDFGLIDDRCGQDRFCAGSRT
jgi:hypothetical protein